MLKGIVIPHVEGSFITTEGFKKPWRQASYNTGHDC